MNDMALILFWPAPCQLPDLIFNFWVTWCIADLFGF